MKCRTVLFNDVIQCVSSSSNTSIVVVWLEMAYTSHSNANSFVCLCAYGVCVCMPMFLCVFQILIGRPVNEIVH